MLSIPRLKSQFPNPKIFSSYKGKNRDKGQNRDFHRSVFYFSDFPEIQGFSHPIGSFGILILRLFEKIPWK